MPYKVAIRKNDTGEIRFHDIEWDWFRNGDGGDEFWWTEGNFCCDCNRSNCWHLDNETEYDESCGHDRYSVLYAELPDGKKIPLDEDLANV